MHVLAVGDAFDGVTLYGPFDSAEEATEAADPDGAGRGADWHVVEVHRFDDEHDQPEESL